MEKFFFLFICCFTTSTLWSQDNVEEALVYQYYQQADYEKATPLLEKLFRKTNNDSYFELYYDALIKIKKYEQAEVFVKKLTKQFPKKLNYQIALGRIYQEGGKLSEANKTYQAIIQNLSNDEFQYREIANSFYRFGAYDMAVSTFLKGREVLRNDQLFTFELLSIYKFKKDKAQLISEYLNALPQYPQLMEQAKSSFANLFEGNTDYIQLESALLKKIQKDPQNEIYNDLLTWQYLQQGEYEMALRQLIARDKRTKNASALLFSTANVFIAEQAFATAIKAFEYLIAKGSASEWYVPAKIQLVNAKYEMALQSKIDLAAIKTLSEEFSEIINQYGASNQTLFALKKLGYLQAYYLHDLATAEKTLEQALKITSISAEEIAQLKLDLGDIYVLNKQPWEAVLIYEQVSKTYENQPVGSEARYRSARLSFYQGNFAFAKSQADVLKASTSQLIANDALNLSLLISDNLQEKTDSLALMIYAEAELQQFLNNFDTALAKLDSIDVAFPNNSLTDDVLMAKAKIFLKTNNYPKVVDPLQELISTHPTSIWIDDAIFMLANLYETKLNNVEEAKKLYQKLITDFSESMLTTEARKRYRNLRGDNLGT